MTKFLRFFLLVFLGFPQFLHSGPYDFQDSSFTAVEVLGRTNHVADSRTWTGLFCGVDSPSQLIFRDQKSWKGFWSKGIASFVRSKKTVPAVDFSKNMVVGIFAGERNFSEGGVEILKADPPVIWYQDIKRVKGIFTQDATIRPYCLRVVPHYKGDILFRKRW